MRQWRAHIGTTGTGGPCPGKTAASGLGTVTQTINATDDLVFVPANATIGVGQVIEFKNTGSVEHTVTFSGSLACLSDDTLDPGATWDVEFNNPGTSPTSARSTPPTWPACSP